MIETFEDLVYELHNIGLEFEASNEHECANLTNMINIKFKNGDKISYSVSKKKKKESYQLYHNYPLVTCMNKDPQKIFNVIKSIEECKQ